MSHKKCIIRIAEDNPLGDLCAELQQRKKMAKEELEFVKKKIFDIDKSLNSNLNAIWVDIEKRLREIGSLPETYNPETDQLSVEIEEGAVYLSRKGDSDSMAQIFQELFK